MEEWKPVVGYEDSYEVSNFGNVRSIDRVSISYGKRLCERKGRPIKQSTCGRYNLVSLSKPGKITTRTVHSLVASAFLTKLDESLEIDHIDRNKRNNRIDNLRYVTKVENQANRNIPKHNTSGEMYIKLLSTGVYSFQSSAKGKRFNRRFNTLEEAKLFRMEHFNC